MSSDQTLSYESLCQEAGGQIYQHSIKLECGASFASVAEFFEVVEALPSNKSVPALIIRQGNPSFIVLKVSE